MSLCLRVYTHVFVEQVLEEQELASITEQQQLFEQTRNAYLAETRRLEAEGMFREWFVVSGGRPIRLNIF